MAVQIIPILIKLVTKKVAVKSMTKSLAKYGGRAILRRSGIFGIYGSVKKVAKNVNKMDTLLKIKEVGKSVLIKNALRSLGSLNYIRDLFVKGLKNTLKQFLWQHLTPMQVKKLWYLHQNYQAILKKELVLGLEKKSLWEGLNGNKMTQIQKISVIDTISRTRMTDEEGKKWKFELLDNWFYFNVKSTSGNFNQWEHRWNPARKIYIHPIRSGGKEQYIREYVKTYNVSNNWIEKMIRTSRYGKYIYWPHFRRHTK